MKKPIPKRQESWAEVYEPWQFLVDNRGILGVLLSVDGSTEGLYPYVVKWFNDGGMGHSYFLSHSEIKSFVTNFRNIK